LETAIGPGTRVGSYEVLDRLGSGGMGADAELLHRLDREARAASC